MTDLIARTRALLTAVLLLLLLAQLWVAAITLVLMWGLLERLRWLDQCRQRLERMERQGEE